MIAHKAAAWAALIVWMPVQGQVARASTFTTLYSFAAGPGGSYPAAASLIWVRGALQGSTTEGGVAGCDLGTCGTIFQVSPKTGSETVVFAFPGGAGGGRPLGGVLAVAGDIYGTTFEGGIFTNPLCYGSGCGTVFRLNSAGAETILYDFQGGSDGQWPIAGLSYADGTLYGATEYGGPANVGTVFGIDPATGSHTVLYGFVGGSDGSGPQTTPLAIDGALYGTTGAGGATKSVPCVCGTIYRIDPATGAETIGHRFKGGADGAYPSSSLIPALGLRRLRDHGLYGTTAAGGAYDHGTLFRFDPRTGAERVLHSFGGGADGASPNGTLAWSHGALYGVTDVGGTFNGGTIFRIDPDTGAESVLYNFGYAIGSNPEGGLLCKNGVFYGSTSVGGSNGRGIVFAFTP